MTYREVVDRLRIPSVCLGGCPLSPRAHRGTIDPFNVIHWRERRLTRRGLRRLLLLVARRERLTVTGDESAPTRAWSNHPKFTWFHIWADEMRANELAGQLGYRFPAIYSTRERRRCAALLVGRSRINPKIYVWANR